MEWERIVGCCSLVCTVCQCIVVIVFSSKVCVCVCVCVAGRFMIGFYMGAETATFRTYVGETSSTIIAAMPLEKREKSTLKYTAFFVGFTVCCVSSLSGPG